MNCYTLDDSQTCCQSLKFKEIGKLSLMINTNEKHQKSVLRRLRDILKDNRHHPLFWYWKQFWPSVAYKYFNALKCFFESLIVGNFNKLPLTDCGIQCVTINNKPLFSGPFFQGWWEYLDLGSSISILSLSWFILSTHCKKSNIDERCFKIKITAASFEVRTLCRHS